MISTIAFLLVSAVSSQSSDEQSTGAGQTQSADPVSLFQEFFDFNQSVWSTLFGSPMPTDPQSGRYVLVNGPITHEGVYYGFADALGFTLNVQSVNLVTTNDILADPEISATFKSVAAQLSFSYALVGGTISTDFGYVDLILFSPNLNDSAGVGTESFLIPLDPSNAVASFVALMAGGGGPCDDLPDEEDDFCPGHVACDKVEDDGKRTVDYECWETQLDQLGEAVSQADQALDTCMMGALNASIAGLQTCLDNFDNSMNKGLGGAGLGMVTKVITSPGKGIWAINGVMINALWDLITCYRKDQAKLASAQEECRSNYSNSLDHACEEYRAGVANCCKTCTFRIKKTHANYGPPPTPHQ